MMTPEFKKKLLIRNMKRILERQWSIKKKCNKVETEKDYICR